MKANGEREDFNVNADVKLHRAILAARKAGRRHGGKLISCTMAFELGAKILLGLEENEEDVIKQDIEEIQTQKAALEQKERMRLEQLQMMQVSRAAKLEEAAVQNDNVQKLAQRILDVWETVILYKNTKIIESLLDIDRVRLTRHKVEAVFPKRYVERPSIDEAVQIAMTLLEGELVE